MKCIANIGLAEVQAVYSGPEGDLWELVMGQQIHIGGFQLVDGPGREGRHRAGHAAGVDLCCCNGAGMRFLVRFRSVARMHGVDATETVVERGRCRCEAEGLADRITFIAGRRLPTPACPTPAPISSGARTPGATWSTRTRLIAEAARLVKPGGTIAFTDWVEGPAGLTDAEAERFLRFMKFPNIQDLDGYRELLPAARLRGARGRGHGPVRARAWTST